MTTWRVVLRSDALQAVFDADARCKTVGDLVTDHNIVLYTEVFLNSCKFFFPLHLLRE